MPITSKWTWCKDATACTDAHLFKNKSLQSEVSWGQKSSLCRFCSFSSWSLQYSADQQKVFNFKVTFKLNTCKFPVNFTNVTTQTCKAVTGSSETEEKYASPFVYTFFNIIFLIIIHIQQKCLKTNITFKRIYTKTNHPKDKKNTLVDNWLCLMEATAFSISKIAIRCKQYLGFWVKLDILWYTVELQSIFTINNLKYRFHITVGFCSFKSTQLNLT